jgi:hypothetical protein
VDEESSTKVVEFLDRNDPKKTGKPFFVWYNPARMHVVTVLSPKYEAMLGERGGKDWGVTMPSRSSGISMQRGGASRPLQRYLLCQARHRRH